MVVHIQMYATCMWSNMHVSNNSLMSVGLYVSLYTDGIYIFKTGTYLHHKHVFCLYHGL